MEAGAFTTIPPRLHRLDNTEVALLEPCIPLPRQNDFQAAIEVALLAAPSEVEQKPLEPRRGLGDETGQGPGSTRGPWQAQPRVGRRECQDCYCFNRAANCVRNLASLGLTT